ncbi:hypothetical protein Ais01nite_84690 [Asanoa ishikariensis]|uniref:TolB protein n=1 Tax=Asanoa ishikariensis TaxID=137265 RepID=A0A1H3KCA6_9ACTN|nr:LpqB family beta-propeller domain-containing protein [Asanoa ishikariensis]GIF70434.1 hypothetical protein Ais01nite_84690 [Asanoa ishikariensis]SDY49345.1 TolB protein [Asanoa ishikariensis]
MNDDDDLLRDSLTEIGDRAKPVDFVDRSLARSKRIGRNRALISGAATACALVLAGGLAWQVGLTGPDQPSPATVPTSLPSVSPSPSATPAASSIAGLPGWLYYANSEQLVRVTKSGVDTVLEKDAYASSVSPDGARVAFVDKSGKVVVTDRDGQNRRTVFQGAKYYGYEPAWSPDSERLLLAKGPDGEVTKGIVTIATGRFTALEDQRSAIHFMWSADGKHIGYATGDCKLATADPDGGNVRVVPGFGSDDVQANYAQRRSCDPYSMSADGGLISVWQRKGQEEDSDIARDLIADTIIDVRTGENVGLPVRGDVEAILFQPNGDILVRTSGKLTLLGPDFTVKAEVDEPAAVNDLKLLAYTPE